MSDPDESDDDRHQFTFDPDEQPSLVVTEAVAEVTDRDQEELPPLYEVLDGDRLDDVVETDDPLPAGEPISVTFSYAGCEVTVTSHGCITVSDVETDEN